MVKIRKTITDTPIYFFGDIFQEGWCFSSFLPLLTLYLKPEEYGKAILCIVIASFLSAFVSLNITTSVIRFAADNNEDKNYLSKLFSTITVFLLFNTIFVNLVLISSFLILNYFYLKSNDVFLSILVIFLSSIIKPFEVYQRILITTQKAKQYVINQILNFIIYSVSLFLFIYLGFSYLAIVYATILSFSFFYILLILNVLQQLNGNLIFDYELLVKLLKYALKLMPNRFFSLLPNSLDRIIISSLSLSSAALYSVGYRIGEASQYISDGFFKSFPRWLYISLNKFKENRNKIYRVFKLTTFIFYVLQFQ